jgi:hypothetical protein
MNFDNNSQLNTDMFSVVPYGTTENTFDSVTMDMVIRFGRSALVEVVENPFDGLVSAGPEQISAAALASDDASMVMMDSMMGQALIPQNALPSMADQVLRPDQVKPGKVLYQGREIEILAEGDRRFESVKLPEGTVRILDPNGPIQGWGNKAARELPRVIEIRELTDATYGKQNPFAGLDRPPVVSPESQRAYDVFMGKVPGVS